MHSVAIGKKVFYMQHTASRFCCGTMVEESSAWTGTATVTNDPFWFKRIFRRQWISSPSILRIAHAHWMACTGILSPSKCDATKMIACFQYKISVIIIINVIIKNKYLFTVIFHFYITLKYNKYS